MGFTRDSIVRRLPAILDETLRGVPADVAAGAAAGAAALKEEIASGTLAAGRLPRQPAGHSGWDGEYLAAATGATWLQAPWWLVENYFYRRLLAFAATETHPDPFARPKAAAAASGLAPFCTTVLPLCSSSSGPSPDSNTLRHLCLRSLWGNRADLSLSSGRVVGVPSLDAVATDKLLIDGIDAALAALAAAPSSAPVVIVLDNCGLELLCDLALADALLSAGRTVVLHAKVRVDGIWLCGAFAGRCTRRPPPPT